MGQEEGSLPGSVNGAERETTNFHRDGSDCPVTLAPFVEPVTLPPCGHTFSRSALVGIVNRDIYLCPVCRTSFRGKIDVRSAPQTFVINKLMGAYEYPGCRPIHTTVPTPMLPMGGETSAPIYSNTQTPAIPVINETEPSWSVTGSCCGIPCVCKKEFGQTCYPCCYTNGDTGTWASPLFVKWVQTDEYSRRTTHRLCHPLCIYHRKKGLATSCCFMSGLCWNYYNERLLIGRIERETEKDRACGICCVSACCTNKIGGCFPVWIGCSPDVHGLFSACNFLGICTCGYGCTWFGGSGTLRNCYVYGIPVYYTENPDTRTRTICGFVRCKM